MKRRASTSCFVFVLPVCGVLTMCSVASAQENDADSGMHSFTEHLGTGLRWIPFNRGITPSTAASSLTSGYSGPTTQFAGYGSYNFDERFAMLLTLDFGFGDIGVPAMAGTSTTLTTFGLSLGARYYFSRPRRGAVVPYLFGDVFKEFASISTTPKSPNTNALAGLFSPFGVDVAIGAEFFVSRAVSIGAEVLGLRFSHAQADIPAAMGTSTTTTSFNGLSLYTAVTLNVRFLAPPAPVVEPPSETTSSPSPASQPGGPPSVPPLYTPAQ